MLKTPRFWLSLVSLGIVLALLYKDLGKTSPGPLSLSHSLVPELEGGFACDSCHGETLDDLAQTCGECHADTLESIASKTGLHGTLNVPVAGIDKASTSARRCGTCHSEHHGLDFELTGDLSFELAGFASKEGFLHSRMDFPLEGRHDELGCTECHELGDAAQLQEGEARFVGQSNACASCHDDPHQGEITWACADCHGQSIPFEELDGFAHTDAFELSGAHELGEVGCIACHESDSAYSVEALANDTRTSTDRSCAACHDSPHASDFLAAASVELELAADASCAGCHTSAKDGFLGTGTSFQLLANQARQPTTLTADLHAATGFALEAPHGDITCAACHTAPEATPSADLFSARYPGRSAGDCAACHEDPHEDRNGPSCTDCHQTTGPWNDLSNFDHATDFPLAGVHAQLECLTCHSEESDFAVAALKSMRTASLTIEQRTCAACHDDPHALTFTTEVARQLDVAQSDSCKECHETDTPPTLRGGIGFATPTIARELHAASGFVLDDAHTDASCVSCHAGDACRVPQDGTSIHGGESVVLGSFAQRFQISDAKDDCRACHDEPHGDDFERTLVASGADDCATCHAPEHFEPSIVDVRLHASARLPLDGAHAAIACYSCHVLPVDRPAATPRFSDAPTACAECHTDIHEGSFQNVPATLDGQQGCARCHTSADFNDVPLVAAGGFDHASWCGFSLEGAHETAACASCHQPEGARLFGRVSEVFGAVPQECQTCHSDVHAGAFDVLGMPAELDGKTSCARCHNETSFTGTFRSSFAETESGKDVFDHALWASYELEGPHAAVDCKACHAPTTTTNLGPVRGTSCSDCHADVHLGQLRVNAQDTSTDCARCHSVPSRVSARNPAKSAFVADLFDHTTDSSFPLDDIHEELDCKTCHQSWPLEDGGEVVRYKPLGSLCTDCHGMPGGDQ